MKAIILAAGMGKRMKDITLNKPKPLLEVANTTIIEYLVTCLKEIGIRQIYVVTGYKSKMIKSKLGNSVNYIHNKKFKSTNSIYSLYLAKKYLYKSNFILMNGDIFLSKVFLSKVANFKHSISFGIKRKKYLNGEMNIILNKNIIKEISKDIRHDQSNAESAQISYFTKKDANILFKKIYQLIKEKCFNLFPAYAYQAIIQKSKLKISFIKPKCWFEIDNKKDLVKLRKKIKTPKQLEKFKNLK
jgi:choline kinase|tara:strand:- start:2940 stop:3671 length:732 start_codon:yes stop_codon:yes gene_type:complete